jgi:tryptophan halogenase
MHAQGGNGMDLRIKRIVIAGGGTAGWLSAAYLNRALGDTAEITLVESSAVDTIGVGEATIPSLGYTMEFIGFRDHEWMPHVNSTYKAGIKFVNWAPSVKPYYWHGFSPRPEPMVLPFERPYFTEVGMGFSLMHYAFHARKNGNPEALGSMCFPTHAVCEAKKCPIHPTDQRLSVRTAHHIDAGLLASFLRKVCVGRGVKHRVGHVAEVELRDTGDIRALRLRDGARLEGDLFIDCTGFSAVLLNGALKVPFVSDNRYLLCDSAVAISCENNPERDGLAPYTTATALSHGWAWDIPLFHRNGAGYVYSSQYLSREQAEKEARAFLGPRSDKATANHIRMRVGSSQNWFVKNCVAIGLSGSFIEPLESTGIFLIEYGLATLISMFPDKRFPAPIVRKYNEIMRAMYEETRDFVVLHYAVNKRNDTEFWQRVREPHMIPDTLKEKLEFFKYSLPAVDPSFAMFKTLSYASILDGNGELPETGGYPILEQIGYQAGQAKLKAAEEHKKRVLAALPSHYEYLRALYDGQIERPSLSAHLRMPTVHA